MLVRIADAYTCNKKTYNNAISALRRAFNFGYLDYPERGDPAASLRCARIGKKDRPAIDPFSIQDAEVLITAIHRGWGEAQGNYDELRFFTGLRPSEEIALAVTDYDAMHGVLSVTKARVNGIDKDVTKTGEDRRIVLCPRAIAVIERQLRLRDQLAGAGPDFGSTCARPAVRGRGVLANWRRHRGSISGPPAPDPVRAVHRVANRRDVGLHRSLRPSRIHRQHRREAVPVIFGD
jgi:integrase